jgi:hypothetical protein
MEGGIMTEATRVKVDLSFTRNLGNYESIKIGIGIEDSVRDGENVDSATERVYKFVEDKLIQKTREVEEELNDRKK